MELAHTQAHILFIVDPILTLLHQCASEAEHGSQSLRLAVL